MITQEEMNRIFPNIEKYTVGFNDYFEALNKTAEQYKNAISAYPPFNIKRTDANTYVIELAVAGFGKNELEVVVENDILKITGKTDVSENVDKFLHKGISSKSFQKAFKIADNVEVKSTTLANGMLKVWLEQFVPESTTKKIMINEQTPSVVLSNKTVKE